MARLTLAQWQEFFEQCVGAEVTLGSDTATEWAGKLQDYVVKGNTARLTLDENGKERDRELLLGDSTFGTVGNKTVVVFLPGRRRLTVIHGV